MRSGQSLREVTFLLQGNPVAGGLLKVLLNIFVRNTGMPGLDQLNCSSAQALQQEQCF